MEPDLSENTKCAMLSTESGIVDAHALMQSLADEIVSMDGDANGSGSLALKTKVVRIDPHSEGSGK